MRARYFVLIFFIFCSCKQVDSTEIKVDSSFNEFRLNISNYLECDESCYSEINKKNDLGFLYLEKKLM